jgi:hypothetical protein
LFRKRPTYKELDNKIRAAKEVVNKGEKHIWLIKGASIEKDALELGYLIEDMPESLSLLLDEITPGNYIGPRPPEQSYEEEILGLDLFIFKVFSSHFNCDVYFKFAIKNEILWLVSFHKDRKPQKT